MSRVQKWVVKHDPYKAVTSQESASSLDVSGRHDVVRRMGELSVDSAVFVSRKEFHDDTRDGTRAISDVSREDTREDLRDDDRTLVDGDSDGDDPIVRCAAGHVRIAFQQGECALCIVTNRFRGIAQFSTPVLDTFMDGDTEFYFRCTFGHTFLASVKTKCTTCPLCSMQSRLPRGAEIDATALYKTKHSLIRIHCNNIIHSRECGDPECVMIRKIATKINGVESSLNNIAADDCRNFVYCDTDYYVTGNNYMRVECRDGHYWKELYDVVKAIRMLELLFDERMDDPIYDLGFTGYNERMRLGIVHKSDPGADYAVALQSPKPRHVLMIPKRMNSDVMANFICTELHRMGLISGNVVAIAQDMRARMRADSIRGVMFARR